MRKMKRATALILITVLAYPVTLFSQQFETKYLDGMQWAKGNIHTHARKGEGDSSVESIVQWYRDHDYQFLVITDHDVVTYLPELSARSDSTFILIPGEEITGYGGDLDFEINGLNIEQAIPPLHGETIPLALQLCIDSVRGQNGIPLINHPNYKWRMNAEILLGMQDAFIMEIFNGCPGSNCEGDAVHPTAEQLWDSLLSSGKRVYGVATDDAHEYQKFAPGLSNPALGWVVVQVAQLTAEQVMQNLENGLFYSSTGVEIETIRIEPTRITIRMKESNEVPYQTEFIGNGGKVLSTVLSNPAVFQLSAQPVSGGYVRAKVTNRLGQLAWIQPVFIH